MNWAALSRMPEKARLYERDVYYREGLRDALNLWGSAWKDVVAHTALLMVKPDGLFAGVVPTVLEFLQREGFDIVAARSVSLAGHVWRAMWWYQLTAASTDRLLLNDLKYREPGLLLILRSTERRSIPAVVHLARGKGSSEPSRQGRGTLRALIGQPHRTFTCIHVPDEPADMLREVAVLAAPDGREEVLRAFLNVEVAPTDRRLLERAATCGRRPGAFDLDAAVDRMERSIASSAFEPCFADRLQRDLRAVREGRKVDWQSFAELTTRSGIAVDLWDLVTVGAHAIEMDDPGAPKAIGAPDDAGWGPG